MSLSNTGSATPSDRSTEGRSVVAVGDEHTYSTNTLEQNVSITVPSSN